jgi:magnesium transporter
LVNSNTRVKVEEFPNYLFCVFYGIEKVKNVRLVDIDFILGNTFIITNHTKELASFFSLKESTDKLGQLFQKGPEFIFHNLLDGEIGYYYPTLERIDDQMEQVEEELTKRIQRGTLRKILDMKRTLSMVRKIAFAHREKVGFLVRNEYKFISKNAVFYFRDVYDHAIRVSDKVDNSRELVSNSFDLYMSAMSNNTNEIMKVLSVFATIALPMTVISSIYGTNFEVLPGAHSPFGFWMMMGSMLVVSVGFLYFFRRKGWF